MPHEVIWQNDEKTIVHQIYKGEVSVDDFRNIVDMSASMLKTVGHPVDVLIDLQDATLHMRDLLSTAPYVNEQVPDNQRLVVAIGANRFLQTMANVIHNIAPKATGNMHFVRTLDEAYDIIRTHQTST